MSLLNLRTAPALVSGLSLMLLTSCETTNSSVDDPYASNYSSDGRYNPYPGQSGYVQSGRQPPPRYETPPPPVEADPYAFQSPSSSPSPKPKPSPAASTSSAPRKPATTAASSSKAKSSSSGAKRSGGGSYTVVKGDTLYGVARKKGTTVDKLKAANGLSGDLIRIGQTLKIP